jgi:aminopeptidase N
MWTKILVVILFVCCVGADYNPFNSELDDQVITPLRPTDPEGLSFRLPNNTRPIHYDIWLSTAVHEADFRFNGTVHIRFMTLEPSQYVTLNFKQINIDRADLTDVNGIIIQNNLIIIGDVATELVSFYFLNELPANQDFVISVEYNGVLRTDSYGFYRGSYIDENGQVKWYGTTQFQATDARHAFPW